MENTIKMDDLEVPLFSETSISQNQRSENLIFLEELRRQLRSTERILFVSRFPSDDSKNPQRSWVESSGLHIFDISPSQKYMETLQKNGKYWETAEI